MTKEKSSEDKKSRDFNSKGFIEEIKSFANTEGKQMVGFVRNKFREAMDEEEVEKESDELLSKKTNANEAFIVLPSELNDVLKAGAKSTGKSVVELIHQCVARSLEEVIHKEQDNKKSEILTKLKLLKKDKN